METTESSSAAKGCGALIKQINDAIAKRANNSLREKNLTLTQLRVLMELYGFDAIPLKDIEHRLQVAQSSAAGVVSRLRAKGLVTAYTSPDDNRVKLISLTDAGKLYCQETRRDIENVDARMFSGFSEEEKHALNIFLTKICENLK